MPVAEAVSAPTISQSMLAEFEIQAPITRKFLERLPEDKLTAGSLTKKSMTAGQLARFISRPFPAASFEFVLSNPAQAPKSFIFPQPASRAEILKALDENVVTVRNLLPKFDDAAMKESWHMLAGDKEMFAQPRGEFLRDVMLSHWYQHRGQFSVYLRILNVAVPASWGPSADERPPFMK